MMRYLAWLVACLPIAAQTITYPSGPRDCTTETGYLDPAVCTVEREIPLGSFPVPAVGGFYLDHNFGGYVRVIAPAGSAHGYSTPSALSKTGKYAAVEVSGVRTIINVADGTVAYSGRPGGITNYTLMWSATTDDEYYYLTYNAATIHKHVLSTNTTTELVNYATDGTHNFTTIRQGGTGDISKDNWMAFHAPEEDNICAVNLATMATYCHDYTTLPNYQTLYAPLVATCSSNPKCVDFVNMAKGVDSVSGKRYVVVPMAPAMIVYSVNLQTGALDVESIGPEAAPVDLYNPGGDRDGICEPGEDCLRTPHSDTMEDADGQQYLVMAGGVEGPWKAQIWALRLSSTSRMLEKAETGGGRVTVFSPIWDTGDTAYESHMGCARTAPACVFSTNYPYLTARDPADITTPFVRGNHESEIMIVEGLAGIRRVAQTRGVHFAVADKYWSLARASLSGDGRWALWDTNFGNPNSGGWVAVTYAAHGGSLAPKGTVAGGAAISGGASVR